MIVKYIGGALLVAVGWMTGGAVASLYNARLEVAKRLAELITFSESEILFSKTEIGCIIEKFRSSPSKIDKYLFDNESTSFIKTKETTGFFKEYIEKVASLDSISQKAYFHEAKLKIEGIIRQAEMDKKTKGSMLQRMIPIISAGIFILTL